jgi:voltage-gated potassium channel
MENTISRKERWHEVIFGTDTRAGRQFDVILLWLILISVFVVVLESIPALNKDFASTFFYIEFFFTGLFTIEYITRIIISPQPRKYIFSIWGWIDFLSILPFYLLVLWPTTHYFIILRLFRLLRIFRILKLLRFVTEAQHLTAALKASLHKIAVFIFAVLTLVFLMGTVMYVIESPENGFTSIPQSIYWTIVTLTTVGYGDITPVTSFGKFIASIIMLCGYAIIAVPTGIVSVEIAKQAERSKPLCPVCQHANPPEAKFCNNCGRELVNSQW